ncbi:hypothetical protein [Bacillus phage Anath]|uniref:Uncharacterized protein n=1 Tax=Bacillus phage Anath TaxID=2108114 RepID=A0A2P1JUN1_9CAUD|nr:hypothetical protein [Bacillus phage Anath]
MWLLVIRRNDGTTRHIDAQLSLWRQQPLRSKMSQYLGKDAFSKGYIELYNHETGQGFYIRTKEELNNL